MTGSANWHASDGLSGYHSANRQGARSIGLMITIGIHALFAGAFFISGSSAYFQNEQATLSVFDVAPPAAEPEQQPEAPAVPEVEPNNDPPPAAVQPRAEPPRIQIATNNERAAPQIASVPAPQTAPANPPIAAPQPPAAAAPAPVQTVGPSWESSVLAALNRVKRYPRSAERQRQQGVPWIRFVIDRRGAVLSVNLERSSGFDALDKEALRIPKRAEPLPIPPDDVPGQTIEMVVPVEFFMR